MHDDDELAEAIAAQILSFTSTVPLPIIRPLDDPRLQYGGALGTDDPPDAAATPLTEPDASAPAFGDVRSAPAAPDAFDESALQPGAATSAAPAGAPLLQPPSVRPSPEVGAEPPPGADHSPPASDASPPEAPRTEPPRTEPISTVRARSTSVDETLRELRLGETLEATGPIVLPPQVYADWERELRSIGRPDGAAPGTPPIADGPSPDTDHANAVPPEGVVDPVSRPVEDAVAAHSSAAGTAGGVDEQVPPAESSGSERAEPEPLPIAESIALAPASDAPQDTAGAGTAADAPDAVTTSTAPQHLDVLRPVDRPERQTGEVTPEVASAPLVTADDAGARSTSGPIVAAAGLAAVVASPFTVVLGFSLGIAGAATPLETVGAMAVGMLLGLPGVIRAFVHAQHGDGIVSLAHRVLGPRPGTVLVALLLLARIGVLVVVLLALAELATAFADRTGALGTQSDALTAVIAVSAAGVVGVLVSLFRARAVSVIVAVLALLSVVFTALLLGLIASGSPIGAAGGSSDRAAIGAGAAVLAVLAVWVGGGRAVTTRDGDRRGSTAGRAVAAVVAALAGAASLVVAMLLVPGTAGAAAQAPVDALVGTIVDATAPQFALPLGIAVLVSAAIVVAVLARSAGDVLAELLAAPRSAGLAGAGAALIAMAVTLALLATDVATAGFDVAGVVARIGPVLLVPLVAWIGVLATAPAPDLALRIRVPARWISTVGLLISTAAGLLLVDGLVVPDETSPILRMVTVPAIWRDTPVPGLAVAAVLGLLTGAVATVASPSGARAGRRGVGAADKVAA